MTAETLKPFISSPSSEHFSPEDPAVKRQPTSVIVTGLNVTCAAFALAMLVFMVWSSVRVSQLEVEIKSVTRLVENMKKKLGLDYLDDVSDLEYTNGLIDDPRSVENENEENGSLLGGVLDNSDPVDYDDDDDDDGNVEDDLLGGANDNYDDDDDDEDIREDDHDKENREDDISTAYPDDSEADSYENDGDNLYDDFEKYKDAKKQSRKTRSIYGASSGIPVFEDSYAQRNNKSNDAEDGHVMQDSNAPKLRYDWNEKVILESSSVKSPTSRKTDKNKRAQQSRTHQSPMNFSNRKIRAMLKSGIKSGRPQALLVPSASRVVAAHYHLNDTISGKHILHPTHSTLAHDGDVYIGAPHLWTKHLGTDKFFHINYGVLVIQERGLYLVYAQIYYDNRYDRNGYVIYHNTHPFLMCSAYVPTNINKSHTCYTSGLIYLEQNDEIHLRDIHRDRVVSLTKAKSFLGLVKIDGAV